MSQPSLEGVFAQLVEAEDSDTLAGEILDVMNSGEAVGQAPPPERPVAMGLRLYRALAGAFPHEFQNVYGEELLASHRNRYRANMAALWRPRTGALVAGYCDPRSG